ncbi:hypothetical protein CEUSTIGMA_g5809.t1 [Chlamydomonas eustigma]|uniref:Uncharacterized protein n=1 Tax=Chlamydomonas eustigma TaxID=1157962 RepID=A0A250X5J8_9CHLO|nr:hypothetical protein CEUSTIGMA_g5809.t1 [Chlamydomonas eustigma]|eukprot:GAX78367.1 hypothetical protein CEUSTIGMA_g5809.t1 [Chlamydomonas eustigma]
MSTPATSSIAVGDLATPALLVAAALFIFIAILAFTSKPHEPPNRSVKKLEEPEIVDSTVYVQEGDHVVRRSTRARKPVTPLREEEAPTPKPKTAAKTSSKTPAKTPVAITPVKDKAEVEPVSAPRTRSRRTPRA